jgi:hypothetical protein
MPVHRLIASPERVIGISFQNGIEVVEMPAHNAA